eukprot:1140506-Pelagomonas_calceolata.AAC.5
MNDDAEALVLKAPYTAAQERTDCVGKKLRYQCNTCEKAEPGMLRMAIASYIYPLQYLPTRAA